MDSQDYFECVPNFSEGRDLSVIEEIADAIRAVPGANLVDYSWDWDHNRSVMTILGSAQAIERAIFEAARIAVSRIDLRTHSGVHPRIGAIDVLPIVPLQDTPKELAIETANRIAKRIGDELKVPVYLYEWNAKIGRKNALPELRKGGFEGLRKYELIGVRKPDFGPDRAHISAGATVVGARGPLVAYNVNLFPSAQGGGADWRSQGEGAAKRIAFLIRQERETNPALSGVRALGLFLESRNCAQVSLNLTRPDLASIPPIFRFIQNEANRMGIQMVVSEVIGVIPEAALNGETPDDIHWKSWKEAQILRL